MQLTRPSDSAYNVRSNDEPVFTPNDPASLDLDEHKLI